MNDFDSSVRGSNIRLLPSVSFQLHCILHRLTLVYDSTILSHMLLQEQFDKTRRATEVSIYKRLSPAVQSFPGRPADIARGAVTEEFFNGCSRTSTNESLTSVIYR